MSLRAELKTGMTQRQRVRAMDWRVFGQRNHITILREQSFDTQTSCPNTDSARQSSLSLPPGSGPHCMSLRELADLRSGRSKTSLGRPKIDSFGRSAQQEVDFPCI